jgi:Icc-related predicted phosphoesterase
LSLKILAAADIHGATSLYGWLQEIARKESADLVILAGDLSASSWEDDEQREEAEVIVAAMKSFHTPTFYIMGNDDFFPLSYEDSTVKPLHGRRVEFGGFSFVGYQYSTPLVGSIHEKPEQEIERDLIPLESLLDGSTVFVTHSPAHGFLDRVYSGEHVGSHSIASLLQRKPLLGHIHGHIHESFGRDGCHFNVAAAGNRRAMLVQLPSLNHKVVTG